MSFGSKKGFTLIELLVYMAIVGVVVLVAGQVFKDSTKMRLKTEGMIKATEVAGTVSAAIVDDVAQMGAKSSKEVRSGADSFYVATAVYMDPNNTDEDKKDYSSYRLVQSCSDGSLCNTDTLAVRRIRYNADGLFSTVEEVKWYLDGSTLYRKCRTLARKTGVTADASCPEAGENEAPAVEMAAHVDTFRVEAARPGLLTSQFETAMSILPSADPEDTDFRLVPRYGDDNFYFVKADPENGGSAVKLSNFTTNYDFENGEPGITRNANQVMLAPPGGTSGNWKELCKKVNLEAGVEYEISFNVAYSADGARMFRPGVDYAGVGFRNATSGDAFDGLEDFGFYPPASQEAPTFRSFRFSSKTAVTGACMAFTFANYSPLGPTTTLTFADVSLKKVPTANYVFDGSNIAIADKQNVKAFRLSFVVKNKKETGKISVDIPVPSNGPKD